MPRHTERRFLPYTPEQMFDLVADVGSYQHFLPWVAATRIREDNETGMVADLIVGFLRSHGLRAAAVADDAGAGAATSTAGSSRAGHPCRRSPSPSAPGRRREHSRYSRYSRRLSLARA